ncbi:MAG: GH1 family beta-glucosidase [Eubacteriales bacterium]
MKEEFIWGAATAAYQIEGGAYEDGRGLSIWDVFCKTKGNVFEQHSGDVACDHYHKWKEDVKLMAEMGIKAYRFSISWTRIFPKGIGEVNEKGIEFYSNLVDELLKYNITPYITLFHWDYPQELYYQGGWLNEESSNWFAQYVRVIGERLGDRVKHFFTLNEPQCFIGISYWDTQHAPGMHFTRREVLRMTHHVLLSHGKAVKTLREVVSDVQIGIAMTGKLCMPHTHSLEDIEAARFATFDLLEEDWHSRIGLWGDPIFLGDYPQKAYELFGEDMPDIKDGDMELIHQPLDYLGQNIYCGDYVSADSKTIYKKVPYKVGHGKTGIGWPVTPEALYWGPKFLYERYKVPFLISENGLSCHDMISMDGKVHDDTRICFLNEYIKALLKAKEDGVHVIGYFQWSLMDNFEWAKGYDDRFGLIYIDYETQVRTWKDSAYWYQELIQSNGATLV